jgi:hypothetical protein
LVLKEFTLKENEDEFLKIVGRGSGLWSWILSLMGIEPVTSLSCNKESIKFEEAAIKYGKRTLNIPLIAVTGVSTGISKPFGLLLIGIIFILGGIIASFNRMGIAAFIIGVIAGVILLFLYSLKKAMTFAVYNGGDRPIATIRMKKSIIEGQSVDEFKYASAAKALNNAVLEIHRILEKG